MNEDLSIDELYRPNLERNIERRKVQLMRARREAQRIVFAAEDELLSAQIELDEWRLKITPEPPAPVEQPAPRQAGRELPSHLKTLGDEIVEALPDLVKKHPNGPTCMEISFALDIPYTDVQRLTQDLAKEKRLRREKRTDTKGWHIVPMDFQSPPPALTEKQHAVFTAMLSNARDGISRTSYASLAEKSGTDTTNIPAMIAALNSKGYVKLVVKGTVSSPAQYRILRDEAILKEAR